MEAQLIAKGWSRGRINALLAEQRGCEPEPEPELHGLPKRGRRAAQPPSGSPRVGSPGSGERTQVRAQATPRNLLRGHECAAAAVGSPLGGQEPDIALGPRGRRAAAGEATPRATPPRHGRRAPGASARGERPAEPEPELDPEAPLGPRARRRAEAAAMVHSGRRHRDREATKKAGPTAIAPPSATHTPAGKRLTPASVYVRIRPLAASGGHAEGEAVRKQLEGWTDTTVTIATEYMFSKGEAEYRFPKQVFGPEVDQDGVWEGAGGAELVDQFTSFGGHNVIYFAYGQTGAGKTHTMLGTDESLWAPLGACVSSHSCPHWFKSVRAISCLSLPFLLTLSSSSFLHYKIHHFWCKIT